MSPDEPTPGIDPREIAERRLTIPNRHTDPTDPTARFARGWRIPAAIGVMLLGISVAVLSFSLAIQLRDAHDAASKVDRTTVCANKAGAAYQLALGDGIKVKLDIDRVVIETILLPIPTRTDADAVARLTAVSKRADEVSAEIDAASAARQRSIDECTDASR